MKNTFYIFLFLFIQILCIRKNNLKKNETNKSIIKNNNIHL